MFRYNSNGEFNVPYGGIAYNRKDPATRIAYLASEELLKQLRKTTFSCGDFMEFMEKYPPAKDDFVFLDPPYDSQFSNYAGNAFERDDHQRLADFLLGTLKARWMLVIKRTDFIEGLYKGKGLKIESFAKRYAVSFRERNDKRAEHLIIKNY
jgi:DNA adenine methylase